MQLRDRCNLRSANLRLIQRRSITPSLCDSPAMPALRQRPCKANDFLLPKHPVCRWQTAMRRIVNVTSRTTMIGAAVRIGATRLLQPVTQHRPAGLRKNADSNRTDAKTTEKSASQPSLSRQHASSEAVGGDRILVVGELMLVMCAIINQLLNLRFEFTRAL